MGKTIKRATLEIMVELIQSGANTCACVFDNFVSETAKWATLLEDEPAAQKVENCDVVPINTLISALEDYT